MSNFQKLSTGVSRQAAIASADLPTITLTSDVTGSGSAGSIATTIAANAVTNSKLAQMPANTVKANNTGSTANATDVSLVSSATGSSAMYRDTNVNSQINALVQNIASTVTAGTTTTITVSSAPVQIFTGSSAQTLKLPDATTLNNGFLYRVINQSTGSITVQNNGASTLVTVAAGSNAFVLLTSNSTANGVWDTTNSFGNAITALTGDVTATGPGSVTATIANNAVTNAKFRQSAGLSVVGNSGSATANVADITGTANQVLVVNAAGTSLGFGAVNLGAAAAVTGTLPNSNTTATSAATASTIASRDANINTYANAFGEKSATTATSGGTNTLTVASAPFQQYTGTTTHTQVLPDATTLTNGFKYWVANRSTGTVTVQANGGSTLQAMAGSTYAIFTLISNGTSAGTWDTEYISTSGGTSNGMGTGGVSTKNTTYVIVSGDNGKIFLADTTSAAFSFTLPSASSGFIFTIKDSKGNFGTNNCTLARAASESIEGVAASFVMSANWGSWTFASDGTNWFIVAH